MKTALITGALGQDGSYMAEYLLSLNYEVWGTVRGSILGMDEQSHYVRGVQYQYADMRDEVSLETVLRKSHPDEIYNFAGQVFVPTSWEFPAETFDVNTTGFVRLLNTVNKVCPHARIYQASSSEMFGNTLMGEGIIALDELSPMNPVSPYAVSKLAAHKLADVYRKKGMYVVSGIVFNHESPRRGPEMVTRKISRAIATAAVYGHVTLPLGNMKAMRDWGFAGDYVKVMHLMLQQGLPDDFVIGTGKAHSVEDFYMSAIIASGVPTKNIFLETNHPEYTRKNELHTLVADTTKVKSVLNWQPETSFASLVKMMVIADIERLERQRPCAVI